MNKFIINEKYENIIKEYFKDLPIAKIQTRSPKFLNDYPEIVEYLNEYLKYYPNWETIKHLLYKIALNMSLPKCLGCGKELTFSKRKANYCSLKCCNSSEIFLKHKEECVFKKYGVKNVQQIKSVKEKTKNTVDKKIKENKNYWKNRQEKTNETKIKKYGSLKNANLIQKEKQNKTTLEKYGVKYSFQNEDVKKKIKETLLKKFGSLENCYKYRREKNYENKFKKYGYYDINIENGWNKIITKWKDYIIPLFSHDEYIGGNKIYKWKCVKCGNEFKQKIYSTGHLKEIDGQLPRCLKCYPKYCGFSHKEKELLQFCQQYFPNLKENDRKLIYPYEIDILIPELKLGIEFDGYWYHSKKAGLKQNYHLNKTLKCNKKGYRLIHIWEDEWDNDKEKIKRKLIEIFNNNENLKFTKNELILDKSWYNNIKIPEYELIDEKEPIIIIRNNNEVENCGYLVYKRKK